MRIVTSIGMNRIERQQLCINSWLNLDHEVVSVQSAGEADILKPLFPEVKFRTTDLVGDLFNRPKSVRIYSLLREAHTNNILILNSDIEVRSTKKEFNEKWNSVPAKTLKMGIRWDEDPTTKELTLLQWGIDAFLITPTIAAVLGDIGMTIGCPAWDYWIPIHLKRKLRYDVITYKHQDLIHEVHPKNWSATEYRIGISILQRHCGLGSRDSAIFIKRLTER